MPLSPSSPPDSHESQRLAFLTRQPFAHRGLHGGDIVENSRAAFAAAIAEGHGIELDVQAARVGEAFVFHDETLERLTVESGNFADRTADGLDRILLKGTSETIPRLSAVLELVAGFAPILIEVKASGSFVGALCQSVRQALEGYNGAVAVMSFNPAVVRWFRQHASQHVRGLVVTEQEDGPIGKIKRHLSLWQARPDFLAYDIRDLPSPLASRQRARGLKVLTWTVRTVEQRKTALAHADQMIYEKPRGGLPDG